MSHPRLPSPIHARARPFGRFGVAFGSRFLLLLIVSLIWIGPGLFDRRFFYGIAAWDIVITAAWLFDVIRLPAPALLTVRRSWLASPSLSVDSTVRLTLVNRSNRSIRARVLDAVPQQLRADAPVLQMVVAPHAETDGEYHVAPSQRGTAELGNAYLRYQSPLGMAERWAQSDLGQAVVSYPNLEEAKRESMYLVRSRQTDVERRSRPIRGVGRTFESLREHRDGDEFRDICWTASARRGNLVTRLYEIERSQPIWLVMDAGRLMRMRLGDITKLDHAVNAALTLAQVALASGDRVGVLAYGRRIGHYLPPSRGSSHLRQILEHLALVRAEESEPDHLRAAGRLLAEQKRRSLIVWITDVPDAAMMPDVVLAATRLMPRHLVLFVVIGQADLARVVHQRPGDVDEMYQAAAALEVVHRRDLLLARLRARGALAIEVTGGLSPTLVNMYLEVKQRNRL